MTEVDFLPAWYPRRQRMRGRIVIGIYVAAIVVVGAAGAWMWV